MGARREGGGGARVGDRPPPHKKIIGGLFATFPHMGAFLLGFSHYGGSFHHVGAFSIYILFSMVGAFFGLAPLTQISAGTHERVSNYEYVEGGWACQ